MTDVTTARTIEIHRSVATTSSAAASPSTGPGSPSVSPRRKLSAWTVLGFAFFAAALIILALSHGTAAGTTLALSFVSIILEALPFVLLGSLLGGLFEVFVPREWIVRMLPERKIYAILIAGLLGLALPVCECAVIPFTRRLVRKGVPFSTAVAYLLAGPIVNLLVGSATLMAYGWSWKVMWARMAFGYGTAVFVALVIDRIFPAHTALTSPTMENAAVAACGCGDEHDHDHAHDHGPAPAAQAVHSHAHAHDPDDACGCGHDHDHAHDHGHVHTHDHAPAAAPALAATSPKAGKWSHIVEAVNHAGDDFLAVGQFLVLGAFVASICQTMIPRHAFLSMADAPPLAIMTMMGLAVVLNLCSGADAFVAASFRSVLPLSAQMGFMVLGPMLDLKLSAMYLSFIKKRAFATLVVLMYGTVFALMIAWHYLAVSGAH